MSSKRPPFELLVDIEQRSKQFAAGLPAQEEAIELWSGIGFTLAGKKYVAPMGEVSEILHLPRYTQIPGVKGWMYGVANVRGRLLPLMDLGSFFNLDQSSRSLKDKRVLIVEHGDVLSGLVVESVQGMQYFAVDSFQDQSSETPKSIQPFVRGEYTKNEDSWSVFSATSLTEDDKFLDVSVW